MEDLVNQSVDISLGDLYSVDEFPDATGNSLPATFPKSSLIGHPADTGSGLTLADLSISSSTQPPVSSAPISPCREMLTTRARQPRQAQPRRARQAHTMMTRSRSKQALASSINAREAAQHSLVMQQHLDDTDVDLLVLRNKQRFRRYLFYINSLGYTLNAYGQIVEVPQDRSSTLPSIVSGSVLPSRDGPQIQVNYQPSSLSITPITTQVGVLGHQSSSTLDSVGQDELQEKGNKGGRVKGTAKSSTNLHPETVFSRPGVSSGSLPSRHLNELEGQVSAQDINLERQDSVQTSVSEALTGTEQQSPSSRDSSLVTAESGDSPTSDPAADLSGSSQAESTLIQSYSKSLEDHIEEVSSVVHLPESSFWKNYCVSAAKTVVPQVFQATPVSVPATSSSQGRPATRNKGVPPGRYGSYTQIFKPNPSMGHDTR